MAQADRKKLLSALNAWLEIPSARPVVRVLEGRKTERKQPSYFKEVPRLVLALEGTGRYITMERGREQVFDLEPGQALYLAPCTWSCPVPQMAYRSLALTLRPNGVRATIHARGKVRRDGAIPWRYLAQWQTNVSLGARGEHLLKLFEEGEPPRLGERFYRQVAEWLLSEVVGLLERAPVCEDSDESLLWQSLCDYLSTHWSNPALSREQVAAFFRRHPTHISRFFHRHAQQNFRAYLNEIRLKRSLEFLRDLRYNVADVAALCGFTDAQYFIQCFRRRFGMTPGEFRNRPAR